MSAHDNPAATRLAQVAPESTPPKRDRTLAAIVVLAVIALAGTITLLPSTEEKAAGLIADERYDDAIELLVGLEDQRELNAYEGFMLVKLYLLAEQPHQAVLALEKEAALRSDNAWALHQLVDLYRAERDFAGEASALRRLYDAGAANDAFGRLYTLYRLLGDVEGEASLLEQAIAAGQASEFHARRLAYLKSRATSLEPSALWTAASGTFAGFAPNPSVQVLASSALAPPMPPIAVE